MSSDSNMIPSTSQHSPTETEKIECFDKEAKSTKKCTTTPRYSNIYKNQLIFNKLQ